MTVLAYYITGHGFGHAIRSVTIANTFSSGSEVIFRTAVPAHFFEREMRRPYRLEPAEFDCGCLQTDSVTVSIVETLERYKIIADRNRTLLDDEIRWCLENRVDAIVSDITPFAFDIARHAGIPSIAVTNFTWLDIYADYINDVPQFMPYLQEIHDQYARATLALALAPPLPMDYFPVIHSAPVVGRKGNPCRDKIFEWYSCNDSSGRKLALIYVGDFGMKGIDWKLLEHYRDWLFVGINSLPGEPANYACIDFKRFRYEDVIASVDCMISKLGYGVVSECMINATPLIYLPRERFAEYPVLRDGVEAWGGGIALSGERFLELRWEEALEQSLELSSIAAVSPAGAIWCGSEIERYAAGNCQ